MRFLGLLIIFLAAANLRAATTNSDVYSDALQNGWENWSWAQTAASSSPVHGGTKSLAVIADAWEAAYFHNGSLDASLYTTLTFWIHGGTSGGQLLLVQGLSAGNARSSVNIPPLTANTWQQITVSLTQLGVADDPAFDGFWIQDRSGKTQPTFYLDDIALITGATPPPQTNSTTTITVDAASNRHPISPLIYGVAFASADQLNQLNAPLNRSGGNSESRYNWQLNAHNRGADWYFESLADTSPNPGAEADQFVVDTRNGASEPMLTLPLIGWVAKLGPARGRLSSFSISKYGAQTDRDAQWFPDAGNGISSANNQPITANDPTDANVLTDSTFQQDWVRHLTNRWSASTSGGVRYYILDNEPSLWHETHRDVLKTGLRMADLRDRFIDYAARVRAVDPGAQIAGPEEWGWSGYFYSGYDQQVANKNGWSSFPDRDTNGGMDYLPWFLDQLHRHDQSTGQRSLDIFTVHYYPQGGEYGSDISTAMQLRRNRSTRSLWDPNYRDETWINDRVRLIPRLKEWVTQYYPNLKIGITEYNWGAENHINGATAQADVLGIFGREGLDVATRWTTPAAGTPAFKAIQMYRNYDGAKSAFGDTSVTATVANPDNLSAFAALRSIDHSLTVMVINKNTATTPVTLSLNNFTHRGTAKIWQLTAANKITHPADLIFSGPTLTSAVPAQSITLFVLPPASTARPRITNISPQSNQKLVLEITGDQNATYQLQSSSDLNSWTTLQFITLDSAAQTTTLDATAIKTFFRLIGP
jgi:hypothetical protein